MRGGPDALDVLAARVRARAGELRALADAHAGAALAAPWVSDSAAAFGSTASGDAEAARRVADELDEAAGVVQRWTDAVQGHRAAPAGRVRRAVTGLRGRMRR